MKFKKNLVFSLFSVTGILIIGKILGFAKQIIAASFFGATIETDLVSLSEVFVVNIDYVITNALATAVVTQFVHVRAKDEQESNALVTNLMLFFFLTISAFTGVLIILSPFVSRLLAPSFSSDNSSRLAQYLMVLLPCIILISLSSISSGLLQAQKKFIPNQIASLIQSVVTIICILIFGKKYGAIVLIPAFIAYVVLNFIFLFCISKADWKISFKYKNPFKNPSFVESLKIMLPLFLAYSAIFVNQQVDKIIVSGMAEGTISSMGYGSTLSNFVIAIITATGGVVYSHITNDIANNQEEKALEIAFNAIKYFVAFLIPVTIISVVFSKDIVFTAYARGKFDSFAVETTALALTGYAVSFSFFAIKTTLNKVLYSYKDTKWPMISSLIAIAFNILLSIALSKPFGILGVTLASSIAEAVACIVSFIAIKIKRIQLRFIDSWKNIGKWLFVAVLSVFVCLLFRDIFTNGLVRLLLSTFVLLLLCPLAYLPEIINRFKIIAKRKDLEQRKAD